jgi:hypothetical protein
MSDTHHNVFDSILTMMITIVVILILLGVVGVGVMILTVISGA